MKKGIVAVVLVSVVAVGTRPVWAADPIAGKEVYEKNICHLCHGLNGVPEVAGVPSFAKGERLNKPDSVLRQTIISGTNIMPAWKGRLTDRDIANVIAYIRTLQK
jgi:mono/diheme cytochrome c family protein